MKKHQSPPSPQTSPEALYAQVNKPSRGPRQQHQTEPVYADVHVAGRGRHPHRPEEVVYADVHVAGRGRHPHRPEEVVYADVHLGGRGRHPHRPEEVVYADVHLGGRGRHPHRPEEVVYADVHLGGRGRHPHRPEEVVYADVHVAGRGQRPHRPEETDYARVAPQQRTKAPLSNEEIANRALKDPLVKAYHGEVQHWSKIVFGNANVLQQKMQDILKDPTVGEQVSWDLAANPKSFHKLAGRNICGFKTGARRQAEEGLQHLCNALDGYTDAVKQTRERILHTPSSAQKRENLEQEKTQKLHKAKGLQQDRSQNVKPPKIEKRGMAFAM
ncbi:BID domain-containing T4SS effector [Bartonella gliris]|uniref:BID domain-containing T4SS effector n=1 Tax=Bartonella gliris TaxID=3004109 RepID=UPI0038732608